MVSRNRLFVYLVVAYTLVEILVDNVLVFMNLTGRSFPSVTFLLLGALGVEFGNVEYLVGRLNRLALVFGLVGLAFVLAAVWQLVGE